MILYPSFKYVTIYLPKEGATPPLMYYPPECQAPRFFDFVLSHALEILL